jgi:hypothetical protein
MGNVAGPVVALSATGRSLAQGPKGDKGDPGTPGGGGGGGPPPTLFSPINFLKAVLAAGSTDAIIRAASFQTSGVSFVIFDTLNAHSCSGVRILWAGEATTLKAQLWSVNTGSGTSLATAVLPVASGNPTPLDVTATFASPIVLTAGRFYVVSYVDTGGSPTAPEVYNGLSVYGTVLSRVSIASYFHIYSQFPNSSVPTPFSYIVGGDAFPNDQSSYFEMAEPVLT